MKIFTHTLFLLWLLIMSMATVAQSPPTGAKINKDKCLGYELEYKKYPKPIIAQVQEDMYQLYHLESGWQADAGKKGKPLNDGILGPITWSWMQRFCSSFSLDTTVDVVKAFPARATAIADFSRSFQQDASTLISKEFALWSVTHKQACDLNTDQVLAQGSDTELQQLLHCYTAPVAISAPIVEQTLPLQEHYLYVLREDDFLAMASAATAASAAESAIKTLAQQTYADKPSALATLVKLLKEVPENEKKQIVDSLSQQLIPKVRYVISDEVLNSLSQAGISDNLFSALKPLSNRQFVDRAAFTDAVETAISAAKVADANALVEVEASPATESVELTTASIESTSQTTKAVTNSDKQLLNIQLSSQQNYVELNPQFVAQIEKNKKPLAKVVIKLLTTLKDIEYPTAELIQLAIKDKILKASGICQLSKSNTLDTQLGKLTTEEQKLLFDEVKSHIALAVGDENKYCNQDHQHELDVYFNTSLRNILAPLYSEPMPDYKGFNLAWDGSDEGCGCVPKEMQTIGYGIFPYWKATEKTTLDSPQIFDFSTFSRVAYFGLSVTNGGKLKQINAKIGAANLLTDNSDSSKAFIREARRYGSKLDWVIEKEFSLAPELENEKNLQDFFDNLSEQILAHLAVPLTDPKSRLRPLLSLGLSAQPTNGDGVTLYFKNYPKTRMAHAQFEQFFYNLKTRLAEFDKEKDKYHLVKHKTYANLMISQSDFLNAESVFSSNNLYKLSKINTYAKDNLSIPEVQDKVKTLIVLLLNDPYYTSLDEIYAVTNSIDRTIIAPLMFSDYSDMASDSSKNVNYQIDERQKRISYIHESFGGGSFWPIIEYKNNADKKNYTVFNDYIAKNFSPGYDQSLWSDKLCAYRWELIAAMNLWLLLALSLIGVVFFLYPYNCQKLPRLLRPLIKPIPLLMLLLPPLILWSYLLVVDSLFPPLSPSSLLCVLLIAVSIRAGYIYVASLNQRKPSRQWATTTKTNSIALATPRTADKSPDTPEEENQ